MDHNGNMRLLDTVFLFQAGLTVKEKEMVYKSFQFEVAKKGQAIVTEGEKATSSTFSKAENVMLSRTPRVRRVSW